MAALFWKFCKSRWGRKILTVFAGLFAVWAILSWLDTTSVELPEFTGPPLAYERLPDERTDPFLVYGKRPVKRANQQAARRWPDVRSCLMRSERKAETPDLRKMNWGKMRRKEDIEVCLFRIASSLGSPEAMRDWFVSQGMQRVKIEMRKKRGNLYPEDIWHITASNIFSTGKTFRETPIPWQYLWMSISRGEGFSVSLTKTGRVFGTYYSDNNVL